jgi:hypothetical protein
MRLTALGRIKPGDAELRANPRARSAVMRVAERTERAPPPPARGRRPVGGRPDCTCRRERASRTHDAT